MTLRFVKPALIVGPVAFERPWPAALGLLAACDRGGGGGDRFERPVERPRVASPSRPAERARPATPGGPTAGDPPPSSGCSPGQTVAEFWPGAAGCRPSSPPSWRRPRVRLIAAHPDPASAPREQAAGRPITSSASPTSAPQRPGSSLPSVFGPREPPPARAGSVDLAPLPADPARLDWPQALGGEGLRDRLRRSLRPGAVLGVEQHRAPPGGPQDPSRGGYVQQAYVQRLAEGARFVSTAPARSTPTPSTCGRSPPPPASARRTA
jgi:hypothetical protein